MAYDPANNLTYQVHAVDPTGTNLAGTAQSFDPANELTSATSGSAVPDQRTSADQTTGGSSVTSPAMNFAGPELVVAFASADGPAGTAQTISALSGAGLTWSLAARANSQQGTAEVWQAYATTSVTNAAITATLAVSGYDASLTVATFSGAATTLGATVTGGAATGAPAVTLTTTAVGSLIWRAGTDPTAATRRIPDTGETLAHQQLDTTAAKTFWTQNTVLPAAASGTPVAYGDTAPTSDHWNLAAVEIRPATPTTATTYGYDTRGNRITATTGGTTTNLGYDQANRLTSYTTTTIAATYTYNGDGLRTSKTVNATAEPFTWDQSGSRPLLLIDAGTAYVYRPDALPLEQVAGTGTTTWYHQDQLGSTRLLTNNTGTPVGTFTYDPYGRLTATTGTVTTPLGYTGEYTDTETGLIYLRARYYDPVTAQFLNRDPLEAVTRSPYGYVDDNPFNGTDPTGLFWGEDTLKQIGNDVYRPVRVAVTASITTVGVVLGTATGGDCQWNSANWVYVCYGSSLPPKDALTIGGAVVTQLSPTQFAAANDGRLLAHETKHTDQWAMFGPGFLGDYLTALGGSELATTLMGGGNPGSYNPFEISAGLKDGGYTGCGCP